MSIYLVFYLFTISANYLELEWLALPSFIIAIAGFIFVYFPLVLFRNDGYVTFTEREIQLDPKKEDDFPASPLHLDTGSAVEIHTIQLFRWISTYAILQVKVTEKGEESSFGIIIKSRKEEKQYLEVLESWYRKGIPVKEFDKLGIRTFKLSQGNNYADIQKIKSDYGINW